MKALRFVLCLSMLCASVFYACTRQKSAFTETDAPRHHKELKTIEALLDSNPEVALDSVNSLKEKASSSPFTTSDANELRLREVQAQYKNRCLTDQSPDLTPAITFFDSLATVCPEDRDLQFLRANAYYYKGVQCAYANDDVTAFTHYLKAMGLMRQRDDWNEVPYAQRFDLYETVGDPLSLWFGRRGLGDLSQGGCLLRFRQRPRGHDALRGRHPPVEERL